MKDRTKLWLFLLLVAAITQGACLAVQGRKLSHQAVQIERVHEYAMWLNNEVADINDRDYNAIRSVEDDVSQLQILVGHLIEESQTQGAAP